MVGILLLDKPQGLSSQRLVSQVKKHLGIAKAGHTGTLDPLATGVLPVALGEATKIIPFLDESKKIYEVTGRLGQTTDTYDSEGRVVQECNPAGVSESDLVSLLPSFSGLIQQVPPVFSAVKFQGTPLYRLARKGREVKPKPRNIQVHSIHVLSFRLPFFSLRVQCSRGTYIRTLIHDLGQSLGPGAHVTALRRIQTGPFHENQTLPLADLQAGKKIPSEVFWSIDRCLGEMSWLGLETEEEVERIRSGVPLYRLQELFRNSDWSQKNVLLKYNGEIIAVVRVKDSGSFRFLRVLQGSGDEKGSGRGTKKPLEKSINFN